MDKRYQVFVSSTYSDLKEERQAVMQALMEMDCIPAGMEMFPAADEEQWTFIQRVIDDCDYYIIVLGGRYGTLTSEGISFTEKEFDYAVSRQIKIIALVHGSLNSLPFGKVEATDKAQTLLAAFREKVCTDRLVKFWTEPTQLPGLVALSLQKTIKLYPAEGWVRSGSLAASDAVDQVNKLQSRVMELEATLRERAIPAPAIEIASGLETIDINLKYSTRSSRTGTSEYSKTTTKSWDDIFRLLGPEIIAPTHMIVAKGSLSTSLAKRISLPESARMSDETFSTIVHQFSALGLAKFYASRTTSGASAVFLEITDAGSRYLSELKVIKSSPVNATE